MNIRTTMSLFAFACKALRQSWRHSTLHTALDNSWISGEGSLTKKSLSILRCSGSSFCAHSDRVNNKQNPKNGRHGDIMNWERLMKRCLLLEGIREMLTESTWPLSHGGRCTPIGSGSLECYWAVLTNP